MDFSVANIVSTLAVPAMAALGGAAVVFSEIDDAPGGVLVGILLVLASVVLSVRAAHRGG